jgi:prepilin signal peptidase PulO-like enzyme (type II secretory pathway)
MYTSQGWGKEGMYACDSCTHSKSIYEGTTIGPYIFFIFFEAVIFFLEDRVSMLEYGVYGIILAFLIYRIYKAQMRDSMIDSDYAVIGEFEGEFIANQNQIDALALFKKVSIKRGNLVKRGIAIVIAISYSVMLFNEENNLDLMDYLFYGGLIIVLPVWLWFVKFKGQD